MKKVELPRWVVVCLALSVLASLCLTAIALTSYTLVKPFTLTITTQPSPLSVESINFTYEPSTNRYTTCNLTINNSGSPTSATVYIYLRDASANNIAIGQLTQSFPSGITSVSLSLTWANGKTVDDVAGGYVVITS